MSFLGSILMGGTTAASRAVLGTAKTGWGAAFGRGVGTRLLNTGKLMGIGAIAGGATAAFQEDSNSPTLKLRNILGGAAAGAGLVAGAGLGFAMGRQVAKASWSAAAGRMYGVGKRLGKAGLGLASFAIQHPVGIAAAGAGIYGLAYATRVAGPGSPTLRGARVNTQYDRQAIAAAEMNAGVLAPSGMVGTMPQMARPMQEAMMQSTQGIVQGMHRGRHG